MTLAYEVIAPKSNEIIGRIPIVRNLQFENITFIFNYLKIVM